jgi:hypothetical protein
MAHLNPVARTGRLRQGRIHAEQTIGLINQCTITYFIRLFTVLSILILLSACVAKNQGTLPSPTSANLPAIESAQKGALAVSPTYTLSPVPSMTPSTLLSIMADFPLSPGATWKYAAEISYPDPANPSQVATWSGFITDKVTGQKTTPDGSLIFTIQQDLEPTPPQEVWRQSSTIEYTLTGDGVYDGRRKIYQWPLSDHSTWKAFADIEYLVNSDYLGDVETPYGKLSGCYGFLLATNPDTSIDTFCPGIGFVEHSYQHHGTPQFEHYVLVSYTPGQ